jgi:hypothetical protein
MLVSGWAQCPRLGWRDEPDLAMKAPVIEAVDVSGDSDPNVTDVA